MIAADEGFEILCDRANCPRLRPRPRSAGWPGRPLLPRTSGRSTTSSRCARSSSARRRVDRSLASLPVTFEADDSEPALETGWSVVVVGIAEDLGSTAEAALLRESVRPWSWDALDVVRIRASEVTGRRLQPQRPDRGCPSVTPMINRFPATTAT